MTLSSVRLLSRHCGRDKRKKHGQAQGEQRDGTMLEEAIHGPFVVLFI